MELGSSCALLLADAQETHVVDTHLTLPEPAIPGDVLIKSPEGAFGVVSRWDFDLDFSVYAVYPDCPDTFALFGLPLSSHEVWYCQPRVPRIQLTANGYSVALGEVMLLRVAKHTWVKATL